MRKILFILTLLFGICIAAAAQTKVQTDATGNYIALPAPQKEKQGKATGKTYTDSKGVKWPVYESAKGKLYIIRKSKETGKDYYQYLKLS